MAWIHHPELAVDAEVPDETAEIWFGEPGWRPGTVECPEPWEPQQFDADGNPIPTAVEESAPDLVEPDPSEAPASDATTPTTRKRATATVPVGDPTTTPDTED